MQDPKHGLTQKNRDILSLFDFEDSWSKQTPLSKKDVSILIDRAKNSFLKEWTQSLENLPKLRFYKTFKTEFKFENYLLLIKDAKLRKSLSQFRLSSHRLAVETGRHAKPKIALENRICLFCNAKQVEDENHIFFNCQNYEHLRITFMSKILCIDLNFFNVQHTVLERIFSSDNENILFLSSKYIHKCFRARER